MKNILLFLSIILMFQACTTQNITVPKKVYYYDSITEAKIEKNIAIIMESLLNDNTDSFKSIYIDKLNGTANNRNNFSMKFEEFLTQTIQRELSKRGFNQNSVESTALSVTYTPFGNKGVLIHCFLMDAKSKKIITSQKEIVHLDTCSILNLNCNTNNNDQSNIANHEKRTIRLGDADCGAECQEKKAIKEAEVTPKTMKKEPAQKEIVEYK